MFSYGCTTAKLRRRSAVPGTAPPPAVSREPLAELSARLVRPRVKILTQLPSAGTAGRGMRENG